MLSDAQAQRQQTSRNRQRARRQNLTLEEREELNARRRESSRKLTNVMTLTQNLAVS